MLLAAVGMASARRWGVGVSCLLHTERHRASVRTGALTEGWPAQGLSRGRSAPSAVSRSRWSGTQWETLVSYELGPPTEEASLLRNWPTSDLPRASRSLFESQSYFLLGPVGTLTWCMCMSSRPPLSTCYHGGVYRTFGQFHISLLSVVLKAA